MCLENSDLEKRIGQAKLDRRKKGGNHVPDSFKSTT